MKKFFGGFVTLIFSILLIVELIIAANVWALTSTVLNPGFLKTELAKVEMYSVLKDFINQNIEDVAPDLGQAQIYDVMRQAISKEWLAQEAGNIIDTSFAYLRGSGDTLALDIPTSGFKQSMKDALRQSILDSRPEGLAGLTPAQLDTYLQQAYDGVDLLLPAKLTLTVGNAEGLRPLRNVFQAALQVPSLLFMVAGVLAVLIVLVNFGARGATRYLGIPLFIAGAITYVGGTVGTGLLGTQMARIKLPDMMTSEMLTQLVRDIWAPALTFGLIIGIAGLVLIVVSFFMPKASEA